MTAAEITAAAARLSAQIARQTAELQARHDRDRVAAEAARQAQGGAR